MINKKHLTKSRFAVALQCPTKLYYLDKPEIYANRKIENDFLEALAEGGFQVGELAKYYFPGGTDIKTLKYDEALGQTNELLKQDNAIIYEAAVKYENFFIRIDVLKKTGNVLELIEVKAKSFHPDEDSFTNTKGYINSGWLPYLQDVAFQTWVTEKAFPDCKIEPYLMLADKSGKTTVAGLNQIFRVRKNERGRKEVILTVPEITPDILGEKILIKIPVRPYINQIFQGQAKDPDKKSMEEQKSFIKRAREYAEFHIEGKKYPVEIGSKCKDCEFRCNEEAQSNGLKDGFIECWQETTAGKFDPSKSHIFDIWNFRKKDAMIASGKYHIEDVKETDITPKPDGKPGISGSERQWLQIHKENMGDTEPYFDKEGLKEEVLNWHYPLHFIDFETSAVAIPFNKGRRPYEGIAFQWSHHIYYQNGIYEHKGQFLNIQRGCFPNFEFIRSLKKELENDDGTIFRYAAHENTFLNIIYSQLSESTVADVPDRNDLMEWVQTITHSTSSAPDKWEGTRDMVDMWKLVKRYYYHPYTHGSNSIKAILPAILQSSKYLQEKYNKPIYGAKNGIKSLNFKDQTWIKLDENGQVKDPYKLLPPLFENVDDDELDGFVGDATLCDGGAAMMAYAKMQFSDISDLERRKVNEGLLRYCELDTLAMVMIWEYWNNLINQPKYCSC